MHGPRRVSDGEDRAAQLSPSLWPEVELVPPVSRSPTCMDVLLAASAGTNGTPSTTGVPVFHGCAEATATVPATMTSAGPVQRQGTQPSKESLHGTSCKCEEQRSQTPVPSHLTLSLLALPSTSCGSRVGEDDAAGGTVQQRGQGGVGTRPWSRTLCSRCRRHAVPASLATAAAQHQRRLCLSPNSSVCSGGCGNGRSSGNSSSSDGGGSCSPSHTRLRRVRRVPMGGPRAVRRLQQPVSRCPRR